jgi:hypothetical protein
MISASNSNQHFLEQKKLPGCRQLGHCLASVLDPQHGQLFISETSNVNGTRVSSPRTHRLPTTDTPSLSWPASDSLPAESIRRLPRAFVEALLEKRAPEFVVSNPRSRRRPCEGRRGAWLQLGFVCASQDCLAAPGATTQGTSPQAHGDPALQITQSYTCPASVSSGSAPSAERTCR